MPAISIADRPIGRNYPPYIVSELSCNHGGSFDKAIALIGAAKASGAHAIKLQTYTPGELTTDPELLKLYERAMTPRSWHEDLFKRAHGLGLAAFSSAFSPETPAWLASIGADAIKIASPEAKDRALVQAAIDTGLPVIISTGMLAYPDLQSLPADAILLHCIAKYPSDIMDANLSAITTLQNEMPNPIGLSDHTPGIETAIAATALGAVVIEKHLKLDDDCIDAAYSLDPKQFAAMSEAVRAIWAGMGDGVISPTCKPRTR